MSISKPWILGYSASHNGSVCLLHGDELVVAVQEERLNGNKRARLRSLDDCLALEYCLSAAGIALTDLDMVVGSYFSGESMRGSNVLRQGTKAAQLDIPHHLAHGIGAVAQSGFQEAAVLIVDGQGGLKSFLPEQETQCAIDSICHEVNSNQLSETISVYDVFDNKLSCTEKHFGQWIINHPSVDADSSMPSFASLGGMYSACAQQIFGDLNDAGKVMGLAALGKPSIPVEEFFTIDKTTGQFSFSNQVTKRYLDAKRWPENREALVDLAASAQAALEVALLWLVERTAALTGKTRLAFAGGVALNCVANERIINESPFEEVFIMPAAEDSGPAIGAAYYGLLQLGGSLPTRQVTHDSCGRHYSASRVDSAVANTPAIKSVSGSDVLGDTVSLLTSQKIVGWFTGGSELGPRSLGQRTLLADPRGDQVKAQLNNRVKHRESFRPFAPVILLEELENWFELPSHQPSSPLMLRTFKFQPHALEKIPAVVHFDGTGRLQTVTESANPRLYQLLKRFQARTGVPILVNTSFNVMGEPIVETPEDALWCMLYTGIDAVVFDHRIVSKQPSYQSIFELIPRLAGSTVKLDLPIEENFKLNNWKSARLTLEITTEWGVHKLPMSKVLWPLLELADGTRTAEEIFNLLGQQQHGLGADKFQFASVLRYMRRAGALTLS